MIDSLIGLRHDAIVGGHHQDGDVGHPGAPGTDRGESGVPRGIQKSNALPVVHHLVRADVLGDAAGLFLDHRRLAYVVEETGFAVVNVSEYGNDRRTRLQRGFIHFLRSGVDGGGVRFLLRQPGANAVSGCSHSSHLVVDHLVHIDHDPVTHQLLDDVDGRLIQELGQIFHGQRFRQNQCAG